MLLSIMADLFFSNELKRTNGEAGEILVWNDIYKGELDCELAVYGSSRAWVQINPEILERELKLNAYNFGIDGHNFNAQYLRHLKYVKYNGYPKYIVHSLDMFTFQKRPDLYNFNQFMPFMLFDFEMYKYTSSYEGFSTLDYFIPMLRFRHNVRSLKLNSNTLDYSRNKGYKGMDKVWNNDFENAQKLYSNYIVPIDSNSILLYETFINECLENDVKLIMVYSPEYIEGQKYVENRDEIMEIFLDFSKKYDIPFLDYSSNYMSYDTNFFYNSLHLNAKGSDIFTSILSKDLFPYVIKN